ncbi:hypothetical protein ACP4OV_012642 [Aristida adscensionis]
MEKLIRRDKITDATAVFFNDSINIPERFIRVNEVQSSGAVAGDDEAYELPVTDMAKLQDPELSALETAKLGSACREWGFLPLTKHGVEEAAIQHMKESVLQFFRLPLESKNTVAFRGEATKLEGYGHQFSRAHQVISWTGRRV